MKEEENLAIVSLDSRVLSRAQRSGTLQGRAAGDI